MDSLLDNIVHGVWSDTTLEYAFSYLSLFLKKNTSDNHVSAFIKLLSRSFISILLSFCW